MSATTKIFAGLAALIHVAFFCMESLFWSNPAIHGIFHVSSLADAETIDVFIKNQGFYNLFLSFGIVAGLVLASRHKVVGTTLITYVCLYMVGASLVLLFTQPVMLRGVFIQGVPPFIALLSLHYSRVSNRSD